VTSTTNIINTKIITAEYDDFWKNLTPMLSTLVPKPILIICNFFADGSAEEQQLKKMMDGSKLNAENYNILRINEGQKVAWHQVKEILNPKVIFLIGVLPTQLGISSLFKINEPNSFNDRVWLPSYSLKELDVHADVKKQLWQNGMKPIFVDKLYGEF
jgi:hypothetical protein